MKWCCDKCGKTIGGSAQHCAVCHETFAGTRAGDMHQATIRDENRKFVRLQCLTPDEMREKGLRINHWGYWGLGKRWNGAKRCTSRDPSA